MKNQKRRSRILYDFAAMAVVFAVIILLLVLAGCATVTKNIHIYVIDPTVTIEAVVPRK